MTDETQIIEINKLSEYTAFIELLPQEFTLSRGQSGDWPLLPSALRHDSISGNRKYTKRAIRNFLDKFKINSYQYMNTPWDIRNDVEWMLYAQHFGIPTRLMDFTTSHITSLLFAVEKAFQNDSETDATVYFLNPCALNQKYLSQSAVVNISGATNINADGYDGPIAVEGRKLNERVNSQKGVFVLFQNDDLPLEKLVDENTLKKIIIPAASTKDILSTLFSMGISFTHIYPDLDSVSRDILLWQDISDFVRGGE
ncbi:FRG domain-containing protein [Aeromonas veronii]|uniref:FRG domain-containing protein n=1 Tax=Aeromonas veronii TaxID=654 RepID=UPI00190F712D|nr:FRG domain-containing protein [Aeromonas veronii]